MLSSFIFSLNIAFAVLLLFWPIWYARTQFHLPWINPFSIILFFILPVEFMKLIVGPSLLIDDGLFDIGYQYAILMSNLYTLAQILGALFFLKLASSLHLQKYLPFQKLSLSQRNLRYSAHFFLFIFTVSWCILANAEFGILNWLLNPRTGYQLYRAGQGPWYTISASALAVSFVLSFVAQPTVGNLLRKTALYTIFGYLLGTKGIFLAIFVTSFIFLWFLNWRHIQIFILLGLPVIFSLMIFNLYLAIGDEIDLQSIFSYFDHFKNGADYYRSYLDGQIALFKGDVAISSFWEYVPRAFWPEKPWAYGVTLVNEIFYPGQAELTNTPFFGGAVEQFADFGPAGVLIFGFFSAKALQTGLMSYLIFRKPGLCFYDISLAMVMVIIIQYAPAFGSFLPAGLYIILVIIITIFLLLLSHTRKCASEHGPDFMQNGIPKVCRVVK